MTKPRLSTKTSDEEDYNSLIVEHDDLMHRPTERRFAVVEYTVAERRYPTGADSFPTVRITHFEGIAGADLEKVLKLRDAAYTRRTGNKSVPQPDTPLDLDALEDELDDEDDDIDDAAAS